MRELYGTICPERSIVLANPTMPSISLAVSSPTKPLRDSQRRGGLLYSLLFCSALRASSSDSASLHRPKAEKRLSALFEGQNRRIKSPSQSGGIESADAFVVWGFTQEELSRFAPLLLKDGSKVLSLFDGLIRTGFTPSQIKSMLSRYPHLVELRPEVIETQRQYFAETLEMDDEEFVRLAVKWPSTLTLHPYKKLKPMCDYFISDLGIEERHLRSMLTHFPQILCCSLEGNLIPFVDYFLSELGVPKELFVNKIKHQPTVLGLSLETIKKRVEWLKENLGYTDADLVKYCSTSVKVFQHGLPSLEAKIDNICRLFSLDRTECGTFIRDFPQILHVGVQNVNTTFHYITKVMRKDVEELKRHPRILGCSVENRLRPRYERMESDQFPHESYSMSTLYKTTDVEFERFLERHASKHNPPLATS